MLEIPTGGGRCLKYRPPLIHFWPLDRACAFQIERRRGGLGRRCQAGASAARELYAASAMAEAGGPAPPHLWSLERGGPPRPWARQPSMNLVAAASIENSHGGSSRALVRGAEASELVAAAAARQRGLPTAPSSIAAARATATAALGSG